MAISENLTYVINHVFLPPKLPQKEDDYIPEKDNAIGEHCKSAIASFRDYLPDQRSKSKLKWAVCDRMIRNLLELRDPVEGAVSDKLGKYIAEMKIHDVLAFQIRGQNAGLIVRKQSEYFSFESFELSPTTKSVMGTSGRLRRQFPGPAIAIAHDRVSDSFFRKMLVQLLVSLDVNTSIECWPVVSKAQTQTTEIRDTVHPKFVTEMLTGILRAIGKPCDVKCIHKRTRDDVLWDNALKPWRRSSFWLLLRVALQTSLVVDEDNHQDYKAFMVFFMAHLLRVALQQVASSEVLFLMAAKISRRTLKLGLGDQQPGMQFIDEVVASAHQELSKRWCSIEQNPDPLALRHAWNTARLAFSRDTRLSLLNLQPYMDRIGFRQDLPSDTNKFKPNHPPRIDWTGGCPRLDCLKPGNAYSVRLSLLDLDLWVQKGLDKWLTINLMSSTTCTLLAELIQEYTKTAIGVYAGNPEDTSLMLLTTMDLWVALDKCATHHYPLLLKYEPGFSQSLFNPLLLPKLAQMERLRHIEQYIQQRRETSTYRSSLVFQECNKTESFSVRYFEQSQTLQMLRRDLEIDATNQRTEKKAELERLTNQYRQLIRRSAILAHDNNYTYWDAGRQEYISQHSNSTCQKCQLEREANSLAITVHEWPLPYIELEARSAVFELDIPVALAMWRDITFTLLEDVFSPRTAMASFDSSIYPLRNFDGLRGFVRTKTSRLQLASESKSFVVAHYRSKKISQATRENVCVQNGLHYSIYDTQSKQWTTNLLDRCNVSQVCTFRLPSPGFYNTLQYALNGTTHTSNEALANQADCPRDLNLHEFYAFVTLRSGYRLQWRNIARELTARILNFSHEETYMLIIQASWQAGCRGAKSVRDSHVDLIEEEFGLSLLTALDIALQAVKSNWQGATALRTFVVLAARLLSLSPHIKVHEHCYLFLKAARLVSLQWTRELVQLLHNRQDEEELKMLNMRALEMSLICHSTYDDDPEHFSELLQSNENVAIIIECCIIIHDHCPAITDHLAGNVKALLRRFERSSHMLEVVLRPKVLQYQGGIDLAIQRVWAGYRPGCSWTPEFEPNERWLTSQTSADGGFSSMCVQYNVLDGSLLVNGSSLTRLPQSYELHATYKRIFRDTTRGYCRFVQENNYLSLNLRDEFCHPLVLLLPHTVRQCHDGFKPGTSSLLCAVPDNGNYIKVLDVIPSTMHDMIFETRNEFCGHQVYFRMHGSELIIRACREEQICEVIPIHAMLGDFPKTFVEDYVHWLDINTQSVEWRPLQNLWAPSADNWVMHQNCGPYILSRGTKKLLDIRSSTVDAISCILSPLEHATNIHVLLNCQTEALEIHLPRMNLDFLLTSTTRLLESKQFRGMVLDESQSFGTFTGLVSKVVLRDLKGPARCVIVPHGHISFMPRGHHVEVTIDTTSTTQVQYHSYQIDSTLGRLVDNGSLQSRLFRLYLHATTSHCLPDLLTGRTGTEEALYGLESAATRSFVALESRDIELLERLASLTPQRTYYPAHLKVMQQVKWKVLPSLSQHGAFFTHVESILDQATAFQIFQQQPMQLPVMDQCDPSLLRKAAMRDSSFQVYGFGADALDVQCDAVYVSRDRIINSERELQTYRTAKLVDNWSQELRICPHLLSEMESWARPLLGFTREATVPFGFDLQWLDVPSKDFSEHWCTLHHLFTNASREFDKYNIMALLSTLAYAPYSKQELVETLLALATVPALRRLQAPRYANFQLSDGYGPAEEALVEVVNNHTQEFRDCPEARLPNGHGEKNNAADVRRRQKYESSKNENVRLFVQELIRQWPTAVCTSPFEYVYRTYIRVQQAMHPVHALFQSWHQNSQFKTYIQQVESILKELLLEKQELQYYTLPVSVEVYKPQEAHIKFSDQFKQPSPCLLPAKQNQFENWVVQISKGTADHSKLIDLLNQISSRCCSSHDQQYVDDLFRSFDALRAGSTMDLRCPEDWTTLLKSHLKEAEQAVKHIHQSICDSLQAGVHNAIKNARMLPRVSQTAILSHLESVKFAAVPKGWREALVQYGISITELQRAERLVAAATAPSELLSELENLAHRYWDVMQNPERLLLEIENSILIRPEQIDISCEIKTPSSNLNSVTQLGMGRGKLSVIVPMDAAALADGTRLVRVVVLKPLAMQMFQLLASKLGGMLNRRIVYMPISRSLDLDVSQAQQIHRLYEDCKATRSIVVIQPEHILSFELMGLDRLSTNSELGSIMIQTQQWLHDNSRDILDESDEILSVKFELIYTMGLQRALEFSPERWTILQHVLGVLSNLASVLQDRNPHGLEVLSAQPGGFPRIRILQTQTGAELLDRVARQLCIDGLPGLNIWNLPSRVRDDILCFITNSYPDTTKTQSVQELMSISDSMRSILLLLKGLFVSGVLRFVLEQKRWRVNYGLDLSRTRLAVPYHAKDNPAARAEFSHPDATILLTALCYYYRGLEDEEIRASFEALLPSDHAKEEYDRWVRDAPSLASHFKHLTGINLSNPSQCSREVFPPLRFAKSMIDFYLSTIVFPAEMKEFSHKLSASGWDISREKIHPTTGFSGTNDSRYVLPLSITQRDLPAQLSTNVAVISCLLRPENTYADIRPYSDTGILNAEVLLKMAVCLNPPVRVVLDVGAQVLELQNEEFAVAWLSRIPADKAQAVIFFNTRDEICVLSRDGRIELLQISPFSRQMDQCLVYLDDSHTRGTNLILPANYRALVTLGPGLVKDRLAQACMRMRKLGKGQSVVFCSSTEVRRKIPATSSKGKSGGSVEVGDILAWCIAETCLQTRKNIPLWATQGLRHQHRRAKCSQSIPTPELVASLLEPEAQSLQQRYGDQGSVQEDEILRGVTNDGLMIRDEQLNAIRAKCQKFEIKSFGMATLQEEQERELSPEKEREQQVERPPKSNPYVHTVHKDVRHLVEHGVLRRQSAAFQPAFETLRSTTALASYEAVAWFNGLLVTRDFALTIHAASTHGLDEFMRPVQWVVSCRSMGSMEYVIVSPHEAHELLPSIRQFKKVTLHMYSPRLNISVRALDDLSFCAIPAVPKSWSTPAITRQLNLFAGQLYFQTYEEYTSLCGFLGLCSFVPDDQIKVAYDGFIDPASRARLGTTFRECRFQTSPIAFVRAIMTMRRKGQSTAVSHVGRILKGELISREEFDRLNEVTSDDDDMSI